tara:strand:- start:40487 stop:41590 length:1104 start_codon:yes stop_codon:yes gene_type:complete
MIVTADLVNAVSKINPIFLEGTLKIAAPEARAMGLKDGQIIQAVIENRADQTKLLIGGKEIELGKNAQLSDSSKFQARVSISNNGVAFLTPTALSTGQSVQSPTLQGGFTPISPHLMNLLLHSSGFANLSQILNANGFLGGFRNVSGLTDLISRILGLRKSLQNISPSDIRNMIVNFGLLTESQLAKRKPINALNQKILLQQLAKIFSERGLDSGNINRAILDIESAQLDTQQNLQNRELSFSLLLPFKEFGDVKFSFFRSLANSKQKDPPYIFNLHTKNDLVGEVWLRTKVEQRIKLSMQMWAPQSETYLKAKDSISSLHELLHNAGLTINSFDIYNTKRPGDETDTTKTKKSPGISHGSVVDVEA